jgi:hypothetical protein
MGNVKHLITLNALLRKNNIKDLKYFDRGDVFG